MHSMIQDRHDALVDLCRRFHVRRLEVFGSATTDRFDPEQSDLDFLVDLGDPPDTNRADQYFGLLFALEELFGRPIDLVCSGAIRNRFFREVLDRTKVTVYAA